MSLVQSLYEDTKIKSNFSKNIIKNDVMMISEETESELGEISIVIRITLYLYQIE